MRIKALALASDIKAAAEATGYKDINSYQMEFLLNVYACGEPGITITSLAKTLYKPHSSVCRTIKKFASKPRLVQLFIDPKHPQFRFVCVTDKGIKAMEQVIKLLRR